MWMTPGEICRNYQQARQKWKQIRILADLNACQPEAIREVLRNQGVPAQTQPHPWTSEEDAKCRQLQAQGYTYRQIADRLPGRTKYAVEKRLQKIGGAA